MVEFLLKQDVQDSTFIKSDKSLRIPAGIMYDFIDETNVWYCELANEFLIDDSEIMIYDPSVDLKDERSGRMVKLSEIHCLMNIFFSLSKETDDIFWKKYEKMEVQFNKKLPGMNRDLILGYTPSVVRTSSSWSSIDKYRS